MVHKTVRILVLCLCTAACLAGERAAVTVLEAPQPPVRQAILTAAAVDATTIRVTFHDFPETGLTNPGRWSVSPGVSVTSVSNLLQAGRPTTHYLARVTPPLRLGTAYRLTVGDLAPVALDDDGLLDTLSSDRPLGMQREGDTLVFRVFAPRATAVTLCLFEAGDPLTPVRETALAPDAGMVWEGKLPGAKQYEYFLYGYRIDRPADPGEGFDRQVVVADPYAPVLAQENRFPQRARAVILPETATRAFPWKAAVPRGIELGAEDAIIYEVHIRDMTMHPGAGVAAARRGSYAGFMEKIPYLASLGVNAVLLQAVREYGNLEPPFLAKVRLPDGRLFENSWNPYAWNHRGLGASGFFAVESLHAGGTAQGGDDGWSGRDGRQLGEFKRLVEALHAAGLAVLLDTAYSHVSPYDENPLRHIDARYYFRRNPQTGFGNELRSERPYTRRLIVDSLKYFLEECRVDGFRFPLAGLLDADTARLIAGETRRIRSSAILIGEARGHRLPAAALAAQGWSVLNDAFRDAVRGDETSGAFIFGRPPAARLRRGIAGSTTNDGGPFHHPSQVINHLAAAEDHTFGDYIRITTGRVASTERIPQERIARLAVLNARETAIARLGALLLFTSRGSVLLQAGQEWSRARIARPPRGEFTKFGTTRPWTLDRNPWEKDDETNWLDFDHGKTNSALVDYHAGLARLRLRYPELRRGGRTAPTWLTDPGNDRALGWSLQGENGLLVLVNADPDEPATFTPPAGGWKVLVDAEKAGTAVLRQSGGRISVPARSGMVLVR